MDGFICIQFGNGAGHGMGAHHRQQILQHRTFQIDQGIDVKIIAQHDHEVGDIGGTHIRKQFAQRRTMIVRQGGFDGAHQFRIDRADIFERGWRCNIGRVA